MALEVDSEESFPGFHYVSPLPWPANPERPNGTGTRNSLGVESSSRVDNGSTLQLHAQFPAPPLPPGQIDLWRARLDQQADSLSDLTNLLSPDEQERAARFRLRRDRDRFVLSRGLLRTILSRYLSVGPREIRFSYGLFDKPFLDRRWHESALSFNVAHSREMALYAITSRSTVGVDVEFVEEFPKLEGVARQFFSRRELDGLEKLPENERLLAFFTGWTRKEAYFKALGEGLTRSPTEVELYLEPSRTAEVQAIGGEGGGRRFWRIETVLPAAGYVGAVAAEGDGWRIRWLDWQACRASDRPKGLERS